MDLALGFLKLPPAAPHNTSEFAAAVAPLVPSKTRRTSAYLSFWLLFRFLWFLSLLRNSPISSSLIIPWELNSEPQTAPRLRREARGTPASMRGDFKS